MGASGRLWIALCSAMLVGCASVQEQRARAVDRLDQDQAGLLAAELSSSPGFTDPQADQGTLPTELKRFHLGPGTPAIQIRDGRSWYLRLALPEWTSPYQIEVVAKPELIASNVLAQDGTMVAIYPGMTLLDANMEVIASYVPRYDWLTDRYQLKNGPSGSISVCDERARYVVVHGVPEHYRSLAGRVVMNHTQYGSFAGQSRTVQTTQGDLWIGLPERPIGKTLWGGQAVPPCSRPDRSEAEFLEQVAAQQSALGEH